MTVKMIICTDANYAIGKNNGLLFNIPEDMCYFKEQTKDSTVIMGRRTHESLPMYPKGLPNRANYVITRNIPDILGLKSPCTYSGGVYKTNVDFITELLNYQNFIGDSWVIGGATVYKELLQYVDEVHWTKVEEVVLDADTFFDMGFLSDGDWYLEKEHALADGVTVSVWKRKQR